MIIQSVLSISNKGRLQAPQFKGRSPIKIRKGGGGEFDFVLKEWKGGPKPSF